MLKKYLLIFTLTLNLFACNKQINNEKEIIIGFGVGTYEQQFREGIKPLLEQRGYKVNIKVFSHYSQLNPALTEQNINASIFQSIAYIEYYNPLHNTKITKLVDVPSAPQSLRSMKHNSLNVLNQNKKSIVITIPSDPVSGIRAAQTLEKLNLISINPLANSATFSINDIKLLKPNLIIKDIDAAHSYRSLQDVDFAIVNGNYIANIGEKISDGLLVEDTPAEHRVILTILSKDLNTKWAQDLKAAYESKEFANYMKYNNKYDGFILPNSLKN